jgi:LysM repeat protein
LPTWALALLAFALLSVAVWYFLFVRGGDEAPAPEVTATAAATPAAESATPTPEQQTYTVQEGDTLSTIAQEHGTTVEAIVAANEIEDPNRIQLGQELVIPPAAPEATATEATTATATPASS